MNTPPSRLLTGITFGLLGATSYESLKMYALHSRLPHAADFSPGPEALLMVLFKLCLSVLAGFFVGAFMAGIIESMRQQQHAISLGTPASWMLIIIGGLFVYGLLGIFI